MTIVNQEHVFKQMQQRGLMCWVLMDGATEISCSEDPGIDIESSIETLKDVLSGLEGTPIEVQLSSTTRDDRAKGGNVRGSVTKFRVRLNSGNNRSGNSGNGWDIPPFVQQLLSTNTDLQVKLANKEADLRFMELNAKIDKMMSAKEPDPLMSEGIGMIKQVFEREYMQKNFAPTPQFQMQQGNGIAGTGDTEADVKARSNMIGESLQVLKEAEPNELHIFMRALARFAKDKPDDFRNYASMLKQNYGQ
jgi:hypothetical protein